MEDKELDRIFKQSLETQRDFGKRDEQWELLASGLESTNGRRLLWLPLVFGFAVICALGFWWMNSSANDFTERTDNGENIEVVAKAAEVKVAEEQKNHELADGELMEKPTFKKDLAQIDSEVSVVKLTKETKTDGKAQDNKLVSKGTEGNIVADYGLTREENVNAISGDDNYQSSSVESAEEISVRYYGSEPKSAYLVEPIPEESEGSSILPKTNKAMDDAYGNMYFLPNVELCQLALKDVSFGGLRTSRAYGGVVEMSKVESTNIPRLTFMAGIRYVDSGNSSFIEAEKLSLQAGIFLIV